MDILFEKEDWHPDGPVTFPVGWVRTLMYPRALLAVVEVQSDRAWMQFRFDEEAFRKSVFADAQERLRVTAGRFADESEIQKAREVTSAIVEIARALREMYFKSFAADAINIIVEWAFSNRFAQVFILDHKSRQLLGGSPPKSFYDDIPKQYTKLPLEPMPGWIKDVLDWVPKHKMRGRVIRPNRHTDRYEE